MAARYVQFATFQLTVVLVLAASILEGESLHVSPSVIRLERDTCPCVHRGRLRRAIDARLVTEFFVGGEISSLVKSGRNLELLPRLKRSAGWGRGRTIIDNYPVFFNPGRPPKEPARYLQQLLNESSTGDPRESELFLHSVQLNLKNIAKIYLRETTAPRRSDRAIVADYVKLLSLLTRVNEEDLLPDKRFLLTELARDRFARLLADSRKPFSSRRHKRDDDLLAVVPHAPVSTTARPINCTAITPKCGELNAAAIRDGIFPEHNITKILWCCISEKAVRLLLGGHGIQGHRTEVALAVDTTGSMGEEIAAAQAVMRSILKGSLVDPAKATVSKFYFVEIHDEKISKLFCHVHEFWSLLFLKVSSENLI